MNNLLVFAALALLAACASNHDSRYRDNTSLERPPTVEVTKEDAEIAAANRLEEPKRHRHGKGLKSDVYKVEDSETRIRIKRSNDESWPLIHQALQLHELKIADEDRSNGVYYVVYHGGFLSSFFSGDDKKQTYQVKLEESLDGETEFAVTKANKEEQSEKNKAGESGDDSSSLSDLLFESLHDEVKED